MAWSLIRWARIGAMSWPTAPDELQALQRQLAGLAPSPWEPSPALAIGGCFVCFARGGEGPGSEGDEGWAAATVMQRRRMLAQSRVTGRAMAPYRSGLLAAREGPLLEAAVRALRRRPGVLLVNATGRDHPRRAGMALQLGWALDLPTVGVTHRPLVAAGTPPGPEAGSHAPLWIGGEQVGWWVRTRGRARAVAVSPGWRTTLDGALDVIEAAVVWVRTPEPIRQARRLARTARSRAQPTAVDPSAPHWE